MKTLTVKWNFKQRAAALLICKAVQAESINGWKIIKQGEEVLKFSEKEMEKNDNRDMETCHTYVLPDMFVDYLIKKIKELDAKNMIPSALLPLVEVLGLG